MVTLKLNVLYTLKVCLDQIATTEKELDTVEVLKAIQKAKAAKDRMANTDKKVRGCTHVSCFVQAATVLSYLLTQYLLSDLS